MRPLLFFNDTATTEIYTLSLHDALPISYGCSAVFTGPRTPWRRCSAWSGSRRSAPRGWVNSRAARSSDSRWRARSSRSEEHTSELQSRLHLVCRLLLEKKNSELTRRSVIYCAHDGVPDSLSFRATRR